MKRQYSAASIVEVVLYGNNWWRILFSTNGQPASTLSSVPKQSCDVQHRQHNWRDLRETTISFFSFFWAKQTLLSVAIIPTVYLRKARESYTRRVQIRCGIKIISFLFDWSASFETFSVLPTCDLLSQWHLKWSKWWIYWKYIIQYDLHLIIINVFRDEPFWGFPNKGCTSLLILNFF